MVGGMARQVLFRPYDLISRASTHPPAGWGAIGGALRSGRRRVAAVMLRLTGIGIVESTTTLLMHRLVQLLFGAEAAIL